MPGLDQVCIIAAAAGEKPYDFPSPAFLSGQNPVIYRLWRNLEARLTVKFRNRTPGEFLPSDLPSERFAWGDGCR
jgi:hypothetical protein